MNSKNMLVYNQLEDFKREHIEVINEKDEQILKLKREIKLLTDHIEKESSTKRLSKENDMLMEECLSYYKDKNTALEKIIDERNNEIGCLKDNYDRVLHEKDNEMNKKNHELNEEKRIIIDTMEEINKERLGMVKETEMFINLLINDFKSLVKDNKLKNELEEFISNEKNDMDFDYKKLIYNIKIFTNKIINKLLLTCNSYDEQLKEQHII